MRLRLLTAYDGARFRGWQSQAGGNTIQDLLEGAFQTVCGQRVHVHGSGRTDAGVHALAQCAHADVSRAAALDWATALNANLPREIRILRCARARPDFHARFSAKGKIYQYRIWNAPVMDPFQLHRAWHIAGALDLAAMEAAAAAFKGRHDFQCFAANRGQPSKDTVRAITDVTISKKGALITLRVHGDGFLYKMVRLMTGALVKIAQRKAPVESIADYLAGRSGKCTYAAPADGLYLTRVLY